MSESLIRYKINDGQWAPLFEIVTASDLPDSGWRWINDRGALLNNDAKGANHLLLRQLQNHLSFPNVSIGNMVFQAVRTRFPLRIVAGMTRMGSFTITSVD
ncbi:MAG: hypothetical protein ACYDH8_16910 [Syntrophales bacterium]